MPKSHQPHDPQQDLADGFEPSSINVGLVGELPEHMGLKFYRTASDTSPPAPRLCELGPCRRYHRFEHEVDGQNRKGLKIAHYCYPDVGIEFPLEAPVMRCSRWDPRDPKDVTLELQRKQRFLETPEGLDFQKKFEAWEAHKNAVDDAAVADYDATHADQPGPQDHNPSETTMPNT